MWVWDDFYIGEKPDRMLCSATALWMWSDLAQNSEEYWWSRGHLRGRIAKSSKEGKKIANMYGQGKPQKIIELYVESVAINTLTPLRILKIIQMERDEAFEAGRENKAEEIRNTLGIN